MVAEYSVAFTPEVERRFQRAEVDGEIRRLHLMREILPDRLLCTRAAADCDGEVRSVGRSKERKTDDMIPVGMSEKEGEMRNRLLFQEGTTHSPDAGARVDSDTLAAFRMNLNTSGFSAVLEGLASRRRKGASASPDLDFHLFAKE